jgi:hypothetical protein
MRRLADLGGHDIDIDDEQAALADRAHDGVDLGRAIAVGHR